MESIDETRVIPEDVRTLLQQVERGLRGGMYARIRMGYARVRLGENDPEAWEGLTHGVEPLYLAYDGTHYVVEQSDKAFTNVVVVAGYTTFTKAFCAIVKMCDADIVDSITFCNGSDSLRLTTWAKNYVAA